jgi:AraC family transcriptional activator of pobA
VTDNAIPFYDLYGEAFIRQEPNVAHVEDIAARSRGLGWEIAPHRHNRLSQIIAVFDGQWTVDLDDKHHELHGNWLVLIPAGVVHGFHFASNTQGFVLSLNDSLLAGQAEATAGELSALVWKPQALEFKDARQIERFCSYIKLLKHELSADEVAQNLAVNHLVQLILVTVLRQQRLQAMTLSSASRESSILLKFRALIEQHYQDQLAVKDYAEQLHISISKLNRLCQTLLNNSPKAIIHQRLVIEAKRRLIYTKQSVEEISEVLGFSDPAYFSRFFKQMVGITAGAFRQQGNIS